MDMDGCSVLRASNPDSQGKSMTVMDARFIITASGQETRWANYGGTSKHLTAPDGEPIVHRTIRQLRQAGASDIHLIANNPAFAAHGVSITLPTWQSILPNTGIGISAGLWAATGKTTILFGDVWFSTDGLGRILGAYPDNEHAVLWFGRSGIGKHGVPWGELFGLTFNHPAQAALREAAEIVKSERIKLGCPGAGGWLIYRHLNSLPLSTHVVCGNFLHIDDETTDFDLPEHYELWLAAHKEQ